MRRAIHIEKVAIPTGNAVKKRGHLRKSVMRPSVCAVFASLGIFGGLAALFIGIVCVAIHAFVRSDRTFDSVGTVLLIAAIPMILLGSVFLDEINTNRC